MKKIYKELIIAFIVLFSIVGCQKSMDTFIISMQNDSSHELLEKPIIISRKDIDSQMKLESDIFPLLIFNDSDTIPAQLDDLNGDGIWDQLFFLMDFKSNEKKEVKLTWIPDSLGFKKRTNVRFGVRESVDDVVKPAIKDVFLPNQLPGVTGYQPYQTDGPSWENDMVGFRHYLDGRNSKDVFGKKVAYMSPDDVGINEDGVTEDNYHVMEDWGRDILSVGNSLGLGGISLLIGNDELYRLGIIEGDSRGNVDTTIFQIYEDGPVHSIINFEYQQWRLLGRDYQVEETVEIWPGFHGYKNTVRVADLHGDETLIVGLVNSRTDKPLKQIYDNNEWIVLATHDKQTYEKEWWLGLALVLPKSVYEGYLQAPLIGRISNSYLAKLKLQANVEIPYYALACWELRDEGFRDSVYFEKYLKSFVDQLSAIVTVKINYE